MVLSRSLYIRLRQGAYKSFCLNDWQARVFVVPFGLTDYERRPGLPLLPVRSMVEPLRRPTLAERP